MHTRSDMVQQLFVQYPNVSLDMGKLEELLIPQETSQHTYDEEESIVTWKRVPASASFRHVRVSVTYDPSNDIFSLNFDLPFAARDEVDGLVEAMVHAGALREMPVMYSSELVPDHSHG